LKAQIPHQWGFVKVVPRAVPLKGICFKIGEETLKKKSSGVTEKLNIILRLRLFAVSNVEAAKSTRKSFR